MWSCLYIAEAATDSQLRSAFGSALGIDPALISVYGMGGPDRSARNSELLLEVYPTLGEFSLQVTPWASETGYARQTLAALQTLARLLNCAVWVQGDDEEQGDLGTLVTADGVTADAYIIEESGPDKDFVSLDWPAEDRD